MNGGTLERVALYLAIAAAVAILVEITAPMVANIVNGNQGSQQ